MCIVRELITKYKSLDVDFWNGKTSCMLIESREMCKDQGEVGRRSVNERFLDGLEVSCAPLRRAVTEPNVLP